MMAYAIQLACALLLAYGVSASPLAEAKEKFVQELEENIKRIPALLSANEGAPKINMEPFDKLSDAMLAVSGQTMNDLFDYIKYGRENNITEFAKYTWVRYDYIREYLRSLNRNDRNNLEALIKSSKKRNVLTKLAEEVLQNHYLHFSNNYGDKFKAYASMSTCTVHRTRQQEIRDFYKTIVLADLMGSVIRDIFIQIGEIPKPTGTSSTELQKFLSRQQLSYEIIKKALVSASRSLYACDPTENKKDHTFASLDLFGVGLYLPTNPYTCEGDEASTPCCKYSIQKIDRSSESWALTSINSSLTFCNAPKFKLPFVASLPLTTDYQSFSESEVVPRICEDESRGSNNCVSDLHLYITKNEKTDRYFHLGEVISDSEDNKVVTGVRLRKEGNFFYIQIQQGKLGPRDTIDPATIEWKEIENKITDIDSYKKAHPKYKYPEVTQDFHIIHFKRAVALDDITPPKKSKKRYALTGLRFVNEDEVLKLEIEKKPYNYETGILRGRNKWRSSNKSHKSRKELLLKNPIEPIYYNKQHEISKPGTYVQFQATTLKKSIEEVSTVPFIDLQEVVTNPPSPLYGAGLIVRGTEGSGGYLSLKLIAQDYATNV